MKDIHGTTIKYLTPNTQQKKKNLDNNQAPVDNPPPPGRHTYTHNALKKPRLTIHRLLAMIHILFKHSPPFPKERSIPTSKLDKT